MRRLTGLVVVALLAYALGAWLLVAANPEAGFWNRVNQQRDRELAGLRLDGGGRSLVLFTGGSSCAFSVDTGVVEEFGGRAAYNLGGSALAGPRYGVQRAWERSRGGDVLVVGVEREFLTGEGRMEATSLGLALALFDGDADAAVGGASFGARLGAGERLRLLRPGPGYLLTWLAKQVVGGEKYRYTLGDLRPGGRLETVMRNAGNRGVTGLEESRLSDEGRSFLKRVVAEGKKRGIEVVYALPWRFNAPEVADANRLANRLLLEQIREVMPVLDDPALGVKTEGGLFADTNYHLTGEGSRARSEVLGRALASRFAE